MLSLVRIGTAGGVSDLHSSRLVMRPQVAGRPSETSALLTFAEALKQT